MSACSAPTMSWPLCSSTAMPSRSLICTRTSRTSGSTLQPIDLLELILPEPDVERRRFLLLRLEMRLELACGVGSEDHQVDLVVEQHAAVIDVGGADRRPDSVDGGELGMEIGVADLVDLHARLEQILIV